MLITHEHTDHVKGLATLSRHCDARILASTGTLPAIGSQIRSDHAESFTAGDTIVVGDLTIRSFPVSHDAADPVGYSFCSGGKHITIVTDTGVMTDEIRGCMRDADILVLESNHDVRMLEAGRYPYYLKRRILSDHGHLSNETAGQLLGQLLNESIRHIFLGHLSKENNYEALAFETVSTEVTLGDNPWNSKDFNITIAHRDLPSEQVEW